MNLFLGAFPSGDFRFDGRYTGNSVGDALLGLPNVTIRERGDIVNYERSWHFSGYFQDDYSVTDRLTLNLGLRYEVQTAGYDAHDRKASYQPETKLLHVVGPATSFPADIQPTIDAFPGFAVADGTIPRGGFTNDYNNFGPRLGFAYDVGATAGRSFAAAAVSSTCRCWPTRPTVTSGASPTSSARPSGPTTILAFRK